MRRHCNTAVTSVALWEIKTEQSGYGLFCRQSVDFKNLVKPHHFEEVKNLCKMPCDDFNTVRTDFVAMAVSVVVHIKENVLIMNFFMNATFYQLFAKAVIDGFVGSRIEQFLVTFIRIYQNQLVYQWHFLPRLLSFFSYYHRRKACKGFSG